MSEDKDVDNARSEAEQSVAAWFITLEQARDRNDFARAAEAQRELERLGVQVKYKPLSGRKAVRRGR